MASEKDIKNQINQMKSSDSQETNFNDNISRFNPEDTDYEELKNKPEVDQNDNTKYESKPKRRT